MHNATTGITVLLFGRLAEIAGTEKLLLPFAPDTQTLLQHIEQQLPGIVHSVFVIAVNGVLVRENTVLEPGATIALMPPFSGG